VIGYLLAAGGALLVVALPWLRSLWDRHKRRQAEAQLGEERLDREAERADRAEASAAVVADVIEDRAAGVEAHEAQRDAATGTTALDRARAATEALRRSKP
jgi:hypothetical protein